MTNKVIKMTVSEIFTLMRKGQKSEGVTLLYNNHYNKMFGVAFSIVKNEDISNDIIHNVVYKLLKIEESKLPTSNEFAWLYTVVKNEALMFLRNEKPVLSLDDVAAPLTDDISIREFVDMDEFYSMIKGLSDQQREVVSLKILGGYTHKEIAKMLGKPIGTVQWIYNTSISKLKLILSSVMLAVFGAGCVFARQLILYLDLVINANPTSGNNTTLKVPFQYGVLVWGLLFISGITIFLIIYIKSFKIPTKADRKSILLTEEENSVLLAENLRLLRKQRIIICLLAILLVAAIIIIGVMVRNRLWSDENNGHASYNTQTGEEIYY